MLFCVYAADSMARLPLLVFSDLDGTLLDHHSYQWGAAKPGLERLRTLKAGLVLASSKTAVEIRPLQQAMGCENWPAIVENGAGVLWPADRESDDAQDYQRLRDVLLGLPKGFRGFGDMDDAEVANRTGLPLEQATLARQRRYSEPGIWQGTAEDLSDFQTALTAAGLTARQGGRFLTISYGRSKADAMKEIVASLQPKATIALGDAPNDIEMIEAADQGVIVSNMSGPAIPELSSEITGRTMRTQLEGPAGWSAAILALTPTPTTET